MEFLVRSIGSSPLESNHQPLLRLDENRQFGCAAMAFALTYGFFGAWGGLFCALLLVLLEFGLTPPALPLPQ